MSGRINSFNGKPKATVSSKDSGKVAFGLPLNELCMNLCVVSYVYWQDEDMWLGHLEEFPDYITQGASVDDLKEHLCDLYRDLTSGQIPCVRRLAELDVP